LAIFHRKGSEKGLPTMNIARERGTLAASVERKEKGTDIES